ncbi:hypothetical protein GE061_006729 [Apolygus lucorum]|uniref:IQ motif and ubiquitin-like domain-containing protein n=1 Tax=Apolygus lucorum TaxID=248454 RepID=A0A6A4K432_APOLU|nr:hypothetical protein GE061_006729 [Apolygus lucorum]
MENETENDGNNKEETSEDESGQADKVVDVTVADVDIINGSPENVEEDSERPTEHESSVSESDGSSPAASPEVPVELVDLTNEGSNKDRKEVGFEIVTENHGCLEGEKKQVIFVLQKDLEKQYALELSKCCEVEEAKKMLAPRIGVREENFTLTRDGKVLHQFEVIPSDGKEIVIELGLDESEIESSGESDEPVELLNQKVIKVQYLGLDGVKKYKEVNVVNEAFSRQYCGGYRNKKTGKVYYNAWSQTLCKVAKESEMPGVPPIKYYTRETQTLLPLIDEGINTLVNKCTQMATTEVYIPNVTDKIVTSRHYYPFDVARKTMTPFEAVLIIQRAWRTYIKMKRVREYFKAQADVRDAKSQFKGTSMQEFRKHQLTLLTKDSYPITRSDFYDLYSILGEWKKKQLDELMGHKMGFAYKAAVADLQRQETRGLLSIEEHRLRAKTENLQRQDMMFLEGTARSRIRQYPKGNITIIDDLNIQRAREFKEMFASYKRSDVTKAERIEILTCIKHCLSKFEEVDMTMDLIELLDREVDFIMMGIEENKMTVLRKRFESLYINLVKNPEFNPQVKYYKKSSETTKKYAMYRCHGCRKVLYPSHLFMHLRAPRFKFCASCNYMNQTATASTNLAPYKRLLTSLRNAEQEKCCRGALSFLLQPWGMYFLVNVLWDGKSVISGSSYLPGLKVTRWLPDEEWSMWNMILLTELEAHKHEMLANPVEFYSKEFVLNVTNRNILGRIHFAAVANIDEKFKNREPLGILPKDHLLYTTKKAAHFLPNNPTHFCLQPSNRRRVKKLVAHDSAN